MNTKNKLIIIGIALSVAVGILTGLIKFNGKGPCSTPLELEPFVYDEREFHPRPSFFLRMNLPQELIRDPRERNSWIGGVWFPFLKLTDQSAVRYFNIFLGYNSSNYPVTLDYIYSNIRLAERVFPDPNANVLANQTNITKINTPEELVQKGLGKIECINKFWENIDEIYLVEPTTDQTRKYFDLQGIAHSVASEQDDDIESPFGLYAAKHIDGTPLILHFTWANEDEDVFFKDKPYSVFDVLWSIRFDIIKEDK